MSMVAGIGSGTFCIIFFIFVLIAIAIAGYTTKIGKIIFWGLFAILFIIFISLIFSPRKSDEKPRETNKKWPIVPAFAAFIYLGVVVAIVAFILIVLNYQDNPSQVVA